MRYTIQYNTVRFQAGVAVIILRNAILKWPCSNFFWCVHIFDYMVATRASTLGWSPVVPSGYQHLLLSPLWVTRKPVESRVCTLYKALGISVRAATYWHLEIIPSAKLFAHAWWLCQLHRHTCIVRQTWKYVMQRALSSSWVLAGFILHDSAIGTYCAHLGWIGLMVSRTPRYTFPGILWTAVGASVLSY